MSAPPAIQIRDAATENRPPRQQAAGADRLAWAAYRAGRKVAFHCGGGRGRTGAVATGVLLALGQCRTVAEAEAKAQAIRPQINLKANQRAALLVLYPAMS